MFSPPYLIFDQYFPYLKVPILVLLSIQQNLVPTQLSSLKKSFLVISKHKQVIFCFFQLNFISVTNLLLKMQWHYCQKAYLQFVKISPIKNYTKSTLFSASFFCGEYDHFCILSSQYQNLISKEIPQEQNELCGYLAIHNKKVHYSFFLLELDIRCRFIQFSLDPAKKGRTPNAQRIIFYLGMRTLILLKFPQILLKILQNIIQIRKMQAAMIALSSDAGKKLVDDPYQAAQIPTKYVQGYIDGLKGTFEGAWDIKDRTRSLQLTFVNLTQQDVVIEDTYFDSGTWYRSWVPELKAGMVCQGTVANSQGSFMTGVTGGMRLKIKGTEVYIYIGLTNPFSGSYKHYGELSSEWRQARYGYDQSENNNPKNTQIEGYRFQVVQTTSTIAQMAFVYELCKA